MKIILHPILLMFAIASFETLNAQTWEEKQSLPGVGRHHPVTFSINDKGYSVTGSTETFTATSDFYEYDPILDTWNTLPAFSGPARGYSIGDTWNGKAYVGFGLGGFSNYLNDLWEFDPTTGDWTELTPCPCPERIHPSFTIVNGVLYVGLGNNANNGNLNDWWKYDIVSDTWTQLTDLPGPPRHHPYMFTVNGDVYTGLGHGNGPGTNVYKDWYRWNIDAETWTTLSDFPAEGRVAGTQLNVGDRGFVLSGDGEDHGTMATGEFWEYDYLSDTWTELPPHPGVSRWAPGSFTIGNVVYFVAGEVKTGNPNAGFKKDLWSYNLDAMVSVNDIGQQNSISLFPNPATSEIQIEGIENNTRIKIISSTGQIIWEQRYLGSPISIEHLVAGIYFIITEQNDASIKHLKLIKQ